LREVEQSGQGEIEGLNGRTWSEVLWGSVVVEGNGKKGSSQKVR